MVQFLIMGLKGDLAFKFIGAHKFGLLRGDEPGGK